MTSLVVYIVMKVKYKFLSERYNCLEEQHTLMVQALNEGIVLIQKQDIEIAMLKQSKNKEPKAMQTNIKMYRITKITEECGPNDIIGVLVVADNEEQAIHMAECAGMTDKQWWNIVTFEDKINEGILFISYSSNL